MNIVTSDLLSKVDFISHGFFGRSGGESVGEYSSLNVGIKRGDDDSVVLKNREKIAQNFNTEASRMVILSQIHGNIVHVIDSKNVEEYEFSEIDKSMRKEGDAIITNIPGVLIGVNTADCVPILIVDNKKKYIAVIHAGWKGAVAGVIESTMMKLKELGCNDLSCAMGPSIQKKSFEVGHDVLNKVGRKYISVSNKKVLFDLPFYVLEKLMKLGASEVSKINTDTFSNEAYFSYRRQRGVCGLQFSGIMLK